MQPTALPPYELTPFLVMGVAFGVIAAVLTAWNATSRRHKGVSFAWRMIVASLAAAALGALLFGGMRATIERGETAAAADRAAFETAYDVTILKEPAGGERRFGFAASEQAMPSLPRELGQSVSARLLVDGEEVSCVVYLAREGYLARCASVGPDETAALLPAVERASDSKDG